MSAQIPPSIVWNDEKFDVNSIVDLPAINFKVSVSGDPYGDKSLEISVNGIPTLDRIKGEYAYLFPIQNNTNAILLTRHIYYDDL